MQLSRLRLVGFKSFVDATELAIEPGLTGIVGPNGCGKSNLVEALRWVMGETSARRLRGGEMDDVIFAGTTSRPARNLAEVALTIDNSRHAAPLAFNDLVEIEVARRIERGGGSTYLVNGREVRARDVQLLFSDAASGAHSGAMVSQGRIGALIDAKPAERRILLEEAAGTAGLHARRRETELKLDAAEENLARLDDVVATIETQFDTLRKQARQAQRYRRLAEQIRRTEALLFRARWLAAEAEAARSAAEYRTMEGAVAEANERALTAARARAAAEAELPPLRVAEAAANAELQRLAQSRSALEQELQRVLASRGEAERRLAQLATDLDREAAHLAEAERARTRLSAEEDGLSRAGAEDGAAQEFAADRLREAGARLAEAEAVLQRETEAVAAVDARRNALERHRKDLEEQRTRLEARRAEAERQRVALAAGLVAPEAVATAVAAVTVVEAQVQQCRAAVEAGEAESAERLAVEQAAVDAARELGARLAGLTAEAQGLRRLLAPPSDAGGGRPILAALRVASGFEQAVGAAFGDELLASLGGDAGAARFWVDLDGDRHNDAALPEGARCLAEVVNAPSALARSLAQAGWVEDTQAGRQLQPKLAPGQRLVDCEGRLWRWDGLVSIGPAPSPAAEHLRHSNRLAAIEDETAALRTEALAAESAASAAREQRQRQQDAGKSARHALSETEAALARARAEEAETGRRAMTTQTRFAAAVDLVEKVGADLAETKLRAEETERDLATLPEGKSARARLEEARAAAVDARRSEAEARLAVERLANEAAQRRDRLASIDLEQRAWKKRSADADAQQAALLERRGALEAELAGLAARPAAVAAESEALGNAIAGAAATGRRAGDALSGGEHRLREAADASRLADRVLAEAREGLARRDGLRVSATEGVARLAREIHERLGVVPDALGDLAGVSDGEAHIDPAQTAARLERLTRERDGMGPVNLIAEAEAAELEGRIAELRGERAELTEAIARLRHGVSALDREVRQRLTAAFERLDRHFAELFEKLFGGGKAQLRLVDDEDPLSAGLEIMASPPGKRLQSLSLLSGGEQALTALALLFAAFLTNPAPVCVLDEVDAPLDDANVDRFCSLLGEIADTTGTRFLVVTHHRITMARVDRLFGVTMAERGVSQLVSVDLARAARMRQTA
jgi:chromosome segregation protein